MFCCNGIPEKKKECNRISSFGYIPQLGNTHKKSKNAKITCTCLYNTFVIFVYQTVSNEEVTCDFFPI